MKEALEPGDLHRPLPKTVVLDDVLCIKALRTVSAGYLVRWRGRTFVLARPSLPFRLQRIIVLERFDGRLSLPFKGRDLEYLEVEEPKPKKIEPTLIRPRTKPPKYIPPPTHPWRQLGFGAGHPW